MARLIFPFSDSSFFICDAIQFNSNTPTMLKGFSIAKGVLEDNSRENLCAWEWLQFST